MCAGMIIPGMEEGWLSMGIGLGRSFLHVVCGDFLNVSLQTFLTELMLNLSVSSDDDFLPNLFPNVKFGH